MLGKMRHPNGSTRPLVQEKISIKPNLVPYIVAALDNGFLISNLGHLVTALAVLVVVIITTGWICEYHYVGQNGYYGDGISRVCMH